jgi:RNA polymerase sigma factor FliA
MSTGAYGALQGSRASDELIARHAELVKRIAYHLAGRLPPSVAVDDLIQAGMLGLMEAAANFSANRGASFETYAGIRIRGAMIDALRALDWAPRSVHRKARAAALALRQVETRLGAQASDADVAAEMGVSIEEYQRVLHDALGCQLLRFNESDGGEGSPLDRVADSAPNPERLALDESRRKAIVTAIEQLPERERLVLSLYYEQELNLKEIGAVLKVTESRVCQLHGQALLRLRALLADWYR